MGVEEGQDRAWFGYPGRGAKGEGVLSIHVLDVREVDGHWNLGLDLEVAPAEPAVRRDVLYARDEDWGEPVGEQPDLLVVEAWVCDVPQLHGGREDVDEQAVVQAQCEVGVAKEEELPLLDPQAAAVVGV